MNIEKKQDILKYSRQLEFDKVCALAAENAATQEGRARLVELRPFSQRDEIEEALDATNSMFRMLVHNGRPSMGNVDGIKEIALRAKKGGTLSMAELLKTGAMLRYARLLIAWYNGDSETDSFLLGNLFYALYKDEGFERRVSDCILSETDMADTASAELAGIRKKIARAELSIKEKLESLVRGDSQRYLQDAIVTMRAGRYVVPVKQEHRADIKGLVHDVSSSGSTYFVEPAAVVEANNQIVTLRSEETREIERILQSFSTELAQFADALTASYDAYVQLDVIMAKARYAVETDSIRPEITDKGISLKKARHPLIPRQKVVPIDVPIGVGYDSLIITGPNTGGKTVTLKTVGLMCLMAMSGMMIPAAQGSSLRVYKQVLADIGDEQSIAQNLSTFSSHITNIIEILKTVDRDSLVLIDELGAGTDPAEGAALAIAILKRLRELGATVIATTHYGEIKLYAMETPDVQNASCEFDVSTLSPTYRLNIGIPGRSNALLISERLGLDGGIIESAKRGMDSDTRRFEDVLAEIEKLKSEAAQEKEAAEAELETAKKELAKAQEERAQILDKARRELDESRKKARQLSADVSSRAYALLDEIKTLDKGKEKDRQAAAIRARAIARNDSAHLMDLSDPIDDVSAMELLPAKDLKIGDTVVIRDLGQMAEVVSQPDKDGSVEIKAGSLKMRVKPDRIGLPAHQPRQKQPQKPRRTTPIKEEAPAGRSARTEINLLGLTTEEAALETERFIDDAVISKLDTVYIIHGRGTGALRARVQQQLKQMKCVKSFRLGKYGEGEDGVTVVELK